MGTPNLPTISDQTSTQPPKQPKSSRRSYFVLAGLLTLLVAVGSAFYFTDLSGLIKGFLGPIGSDGQDELTPLTDCPGDGMIAYWPFNEGTGNKVKDAVGNNDGTIYGDYTWVENKDGSVALYIKDGYVDFGNDKTLNMGTSDVTIVARIKTTDEAAYFFGKQESAYDKRKGYLFALSSPTSNQTGSSLFWFMDGNYSYQVDEEGVDIPGPNNGKTYCVNPPGYTYTCGAADQYVYIKKNKYPPAEVFVNDGEWHIVSGVLNRKEDGGGDMRAYMDAKDFSHSYKPQPQFSLDNDGNLMVGWNQPGKDMSFSGLVSDIAIYKKALSPEEVQILHSRPFTSKLCKLAELKEPTVDFKSGLVSHFTFNETGAEGKTVENSVPNTSYAFLKDADAANTDGVTLPVLVEGKIGNALKFDGIDDYMDTGSNPLNNGSLTFSAWINPSTSQLDKEGYIQKTDSSKPYVMFGSDNSTKFRLGYDDQFCDIKTPANSVEAEEWTYVTATYNSLTGEQAIYLNGEERAFANMYKSPKCSTLSGGGTYTVGMGGANVSSPFNGAIDEPRVYNRALTAAEAKALYSEQVKEALALESEGAAEAAAEAAAKVCKYEGATYQSGETIKVNECATCQCLNGGLSSCTNLCEDEQEDKQPIYCTYGSKTYSQGSLINTDECNTCYCGQEGTFSCTSNTCKKEKPVVKPEVANTDEPADEPAVKAESAYCIEGTTKRAFTDLSEGEVKTAVEYLSQLMVDDGRIAEGFKVNNGYEYRPNNSVSRAEFAKILLYATRCEDIKECNEDFTEKPLPELKITDVETSQWYYKTIRCGLKHEILYGNDNDKFRPNEAITRAEATEMLVNAAEINIAKYSAAEKFTDVKTTDWFNKTIGAAADMKVIFGYSDGTFGPNNPITRGEAAVIITRYLYYASQ